MIAELLKPFKYCMLPIRTLTFAKTASIEGVVNTVEFARDDKIICEIEFVSRY